PASPKGLTPCQLLRIDEIDDEDQRAARKGVRSASRAVSQRRRDRQLPAATSLHARDTLLPTSNQPRERELDRLAAVPGRIELLAGLEVHPHVVDLNHAARHGLSTVADHQVLDHELFRRRTSPSVNLRLRHFCHSPHASLHRPANFLLKKSTPPLPYAGGGVSQHRLYVAGIVHANHFLTRLG